MRITALTESGQYKGKQELTLEDGRRLIVSPDVAAQFFLYPGKEVSEADLMEIKSAFGQDETRKKALKILDVRAMSRRELVDKLMLKDVEREAAEEAADWLVEIGALDDAQYAGMVVRHYGAKGYGPGRIQQELMRRGIDRELWDEAMDELPQQDDALDSFIWQKLRGEDPDRKLEKKVADALFRRGFRWEEISEGLRRYRASLEEN